MKFKLMFISLVSIAFVAGWGQHQGHAHNGEDHGSDHATQEAGSKMEHGGMTDHMTGEGAKATKAVEVGNKICPVSGDKIPAPGETSAMGEVVKYEYKGKIYNLCCTMCAKDFKKDPEKYSKIAEEEVNREGNTESNGGHEQHPMTMEINKN